MFVLDLLILSVAAFALWVCGVTTLPRIAACLAVVAIAMILWQGLSSDLVAAYAPALHVPTPLELLQRLWSSAT